MFKVSSAYITSTNDDQVMLESTWFQTSVISGKKREFSKCFSFQFEVYLKLNFHSSPILVESGARITATAAQSDLKCVIYKVWN